MKTPREQNKKISGAVNTIEINGDYTHTQVTVGGRNTGIVSVSARPLLFKNLPVDFLDDEFEGIEGGEINLEATPKKLTFTIVNKRLSALRFADAGEGELDVYVRSWGAVNN